MNDSVCPNRSRPPLRLITVNRFPESLTHEEDAAVERFAARCAVFQNHYLQQSDWASLTCENETSMGGVLRDFSAKCRGAIFAPYNDSFAREAPDWCEGIPPEEFGSWQTAKTISTHIERLGTPEFLWLHFRLPDSESNAAFGTVVEALSQTKNAITILTAISGAADSQQPTPFATQWPELAFRVPLWIDAPGLHGCTVQTITGTNDVVFTIGSAFSQRSFGASYDDNRTPRDLIEIAGCPGRKIERSVLLKTETFNALRTNDFLLVHSTSPPEAATPDASPIGLFAKPEDVWNIHDVSGEYQSVVAEMKAML